MAKVEKKANNFSQKLGHLSVIFMIGTFQVVAMAGSAPVKKMQASYILKVTWSRCVVRAKTAWIPYRDSKAGMSDMPLYQGK